jgi:hypothetical protein
MMMKHRVLADAAGLSDRDLLARLGDLAGRERAALVELLAHLAELDTRRGAYLAAGYGSLFAYCTGALRLSEDAAYNRVEAARACRRFLLSVRCRAHNQYEAEVDFGERAVRPRRSKGGPSLTAGP